MGIFQKVKDKAVRKLMVSQMKKQGATEEQINMISELLDSNPDMFEAMGEKIKVRVDNGEDQMVAAQSVMMEYQGELQKMMMKDPAMLQKMKVEMMKAQAANRKGK